MTTISASPKPVFILLHGAWHGPWCWDPIVSHLNGAGFEAVCPTLPSTNLKPPPSAFQRDKDVIRSSVIQLLDQGTDVLLVMHSLAGIAGGDALGGLDQKSRAAIGKSSSVIRLVYINSFLVPEGFQHSPSGTSEGFLPSMVTDFKAGVATVDPSGAKDLLYQDLDDENVAKLCAKLLPQSLDVYWSKTSTAAWRCIPTTYVRCMKDMPSTVAAIQWMIDNAREGGKHQIDNVLEIDGGHSAIISQPKQIAEILCSEAIR